MRNSTSSRISYFGEGFETLNFVLRLWQKRKFIVLLMFISLFSGLLFALLAEKKYVASVQILPQKEESMNLELGALAGLAGINVGSMFGDNLSVSAELYPQIVGSYYFLDRLINSDFILNDEKISLKDYFLDEPDLGETILNYTIKLPWTLKAKYFPSSGFDLGVAGFQNQQIILQSEEDADLFEAVKSIISVSSIGDGGLVTLSVELNDPLLAAQITHRALELLQHFVVEYRTRQISAELEFIEQRYAEMSLEFEGARERYLNYKDRHRFQVGERVEFEFKILEDEYNRKEGVFTDLARQLEQTKLLMRKEIPEFVVFEPVKVPLEKSSPRTMVILFLSFFFSFFLAVALVAAYDFYTELRQGLLVINEDAK